MKTFATAPNTLDEIVFEHRNKEYGAYLLRTTYTTSLSKATFIGVSFFLLMLLANFIFARRGEEKGRIIDVDLTAKNIPDEPQPIIEKIKEPEPPKEVEQLKEVKYITLEVVKNTENESPPPPQSEIDDAVIGTENKDGKAVTSIAETPPVEAPPAIIKAVLEPEESNAPFLTVEEKPSFIGGDKEMYKFLSNNLKYPSAAQRANIQGKVFLKFIVEKDGSISGVETMKGIGFGCDEEAARVVKLMPKWIAGRQNGRNVRVFFTLPVFFRLDN
jgi:periplasmic protein TonB